MSILTVKDLSISYGGTEGIRGVSFDLEQGDYLCVVGENGSGKSTLIKGLLGLLHPVSGSITFHGARQSEIGYVSQQKPTQKDFPAHVLEIVLSGRLNRKGLMSFYTKKDREQANYNIKKLGIDSIKKTSFRNLSGGQQQRVLLARALCAAEKLLLLDEPMAGLDPIVSAELYALIEELNRNKGLTVIMVSHDMKSAVKYGGKILHLRKSPLFFGTAEEYVNTEIFRKMMGVVLDD